MATGLRNFQDTDIRLVAIAVSVVFSLIVIAGNPVPNDDAFSYIKAAETFAQDGLYATLSGFGWYGYSVLIALVNKLLPIGLINSAHVLNTVSFALLTHAFITLVGEFDDSKEARLYSALVILCYPTINEMRYLLIRDFGYWACCLLALIQLIRFNHDGRTIHACGWLAAMAAAIFFRLEGLLILCLSPLALLLPVAGRNHQRLRRPGILLLLVAAGLAAVLGVFLLLGINLVAIFSYAYRWYLPLLTDFSATIQGAADSSNVSFHLSEDLARFTGKGLFVLFAGYFWVVIANLFMSLGPAASCFTAYCLLTRRVSMIQVSRWPWLAFLASSLLALLLFVAIMQFLTTRYAVMAALLLLVCVPVGLAKLYRQCVQEGRQRLFRQVLAAGIFYFVVDSLVSFGYSKAYIEDAIEWSQANIPAGSTLRTNNFAVAYYSGLVSDYDMTDIDPGASLASANAYDYLALDLAHNDSDAMAVLDSHTELTQLARFANKRDDAIIFYQVLRPGNF